MVLWGDGFQSEIVFIDDFVNALISLAGSHSNDLVNIGSGKEHSIRYFAELICALAGYDLRRIGFDVSH